MGCRKIELDQLLSTEASAAIYVEQVIDVLLRNGVADDDPRLIEQHGLSTTIRAGFQSETEHAATQAVAQYLRLGRIMQAHGDEHMSSDEFKLYLMEHDAATASMRQRGVNIGKVSCALYNLHVIDDETVLEMVTPPVAMTAVAA